MNNMNIDNSFDRYDHSYSTFSIVRPGSRDPSRCDVSSWHHRPVRPEHGTLRFMCPDQDDEVVDPVEIGADREFLVNSESAAVVGEGGSRPSDEPGSFNVQGRRYSLACPHRGTHCPRNLLLPH